MKSPFTGAIGLEAAAILTFSCHPPSIEAGRRAALVCGAISITSQEARTCSGRRFVNLRNVAPVQKSRNACKLLVCAGAFLSHVSLASDAHIVQQTWIQTLTSTSDCPRHWVFLRLCTSHMRCRRKSCLCMQQSDEVRSRSARTATPASTKMQILSGGGDWSPRMPSVVIRTAWLFLTTWNSHFRKS